MRTKDEIAVNELTGNLNKYPSASKMDGYVALISGTENEMSIGKTILNKLKGRKDCLAASPITTDVTQEIFLRSDLDINVLIMSHGAMHLDWIGEMKEEEIKRVIDVNLYGTINLVNAFVKATISSPFRKKILSIGSMAYRTVLNGSSPYCAAKAGVAQFIRCTAFELAPKGYDVYCIHPSNVDGTPMANETIGQLERFRSLSHIEARAYWASNYLRGRSLTAGEIADLAVYLIEGDKGFLSGSQFDMTGGQR